MLRCGGARRAGRGVAKAATFQHGRRHVAALGPRGSRQALASGPNPRRTGGQQPLRMQPDTARPVHHFLPEALQRRQPRKRRSI